MLKSSDWLKLTPERLDACAEAEPRAALYHAAGLLTPERLHACAAKDPDTALRRVADRLSPERLDACAAIVEAPLALQYASNRLTHARLHACAAAAPGPALRYAASLLTPERLDACAVATPRSALRYAAERLSPERLDACAAVAPDPALRYAASLLTSERLDACAATAPGPALRYAASLLTPDRLDACAAAVPPLGQCERLRGISIPEFLKPLCEPVPTWMQIWLTAPSQLCAREVLNSFMNSRTVYYPGSQYDGHPVALLNKSHSCHCFIYVDYGLRRDDLINEIHTDDFMGYEPVKRIDLSISDFEVNFLNSETRAIRPRRFGLLKDEMPYGFIQLFQRRKDFTDAHGAELFSVLFLYADGHAAYDAVYVRQGSVKPPFAVVLQDHGFGGNWAHFGDSGPMHEVARRSGQLPIYLLVARNTRPWAGYVRSQDSSCAPIMSSVGGMHDRPTTHPRTLWERGSER